MALQAENIRALHGKAEELKAKLAAARRRGTSVVVWPVLVWGQPRDRFISYNHAAMELSDATFGPGHPVERRTFMAMVAGSLLAAPLAVRAQPVAKVWRIGLLGTVPLTEPGAARLWGGFFEGLEQLGYVEGKNIVIDGRYSEGRSERLPGLAAELVRLKVDVIVAAAYTAAAAKVATSTIPIVMPNDPDPAGRGLVASLAKPGGNVTGLTTLTPDLVGKGLQLLKEVLPRVSRVAVLSNPGDPIHPRSLREAAVAARALNVRLQILKAQAPAEVAGALSAATKESVDALLVLGDPMFFGERERITGLAAKSRLPLIAHQSEFAEAGGLLSYGINQRNNFRRAATYVDKILKGAKPAELPVEQPTKFELVINLKTAKVLGLTIPPSLLARADQVIE